MFREAANIVGDLRGLASTGVRAVRTRVELLGIELKEEKAWLMRCLVLAVTALYLGTFGLLLGVGALVLSASEANRPMILGIFALLFIAAGVGAGLYVYNSSRKRSPIFKDTLAILRGDESGLQQMLRGTGD